MSARSASGAEPSSWFDMGGAAPPTTTHKWGWNKRENERGEEREREVRKRERREERKERREEGEERNERGKRERRERRESQREREREHHPLLNPASKASTPRAGMHLT